MTRFWTPGAKSGGPTMTQAAAPGQAAQPPAPGSQRSCAGVHAFLALSRAVEKKTPPCRIQVIPIDYQVGRGVSIQNEVFLMKFICLGFHDEASWSEMPRASAHRSWSSVSSYDDELRRGGHFLSGEALSSPERSNCTLPKRGDCRHRWPLRRDQGATRRYSLPGSQGPEPCDPVDVQASRSTRWGVRDPPANEEINALIAAEERVDHGTTGPDRKTPTWWRPCGPDCATGCPRRRATALMGAQRVGARSPSRSEAFPIPGLPRR